MKLNRFANWIISKRQNSGNWVIVFGSLMDCRVAGGDLLGVTLSGGFENMRPIDLRAATDPVAAFEQPSDALGDAMVGW
jgi:hypothetical protein